MSYYEFTINVPDVSKEAVTNKLTEIGSTGFLEREDNLIAYFENHGQIAELCEEISRLREILQSSGLDPALFFDYVILPELDWNDNWKKNFTPIDVGENFTIIPSWLEHQTDRIPIIIDPAMVFGTGHHETTQTCIVFIEKYSPLINKQNFLDIGTGSGILAISAARLGFQHVEALDIDPLAIDTALRNAEANGMVDILFHKGDISIISETFDLIVANLFSELLIEISSEIVPRLKRGGIAIFSGILAGNEQDMIEAYTKAGLQLQELSVGLEWATIALAKLERTAYP